MEKKSRGIIGPGLALLLGICPEDSEADADWLVGKTLHMRIFDGPSGVRDKSVLEIGGGLAVVSQFTLFASTRKGTRPSYHRAAKPEKAAPLYVYTVKAFARESGQQVVAGEFGAFMELELINDGPVTIVVDTKLRE